MPTIFKAIQAISIIFIIIYAFILWKFAEKTNRPGWSLLIPIYSNFVWCDIIKIETIWAVASFLPMIMMKINPSSLPIFYLSGLVELMVQYYFCQNIAKRFGKGFLFTLGLFFIKPIFLAILAFNKKCRYTEW